MTTPRHATPRRAPVRPAPRTGPAALALGALVPGALALGMLAALPGCNIVGPAAVLIAGPPKTPAQFTLPEERSAVVLIDDRQSRVPRRVLRVVMGEQAERTLLQKRVVKDMVSTQSALQAAGRDGPDGPTPITEIGRRVGADLVIYAEVEEFTLTSDGTTYRPQSTLRVRVLDVAAETRLWPQRDDGFRLITTMPTGRTAMPTSTSEAFKAQEELARAAGTDLARLFFKHETQRDVVTPN